jgi:transcriptional regulator with XRE-family HTH domain
MTPFGAKLRAMRKSRGILLKDMAAAIGVSGAYLSALEHGHRGRPSWPTVQRIIAYFNVIWDEADELERLAQISDPRVTIATAGLSPLATEYANRLAESISRLHEHQLQNMLDHLKTLDNGTASSSDGGPQAFDRLLPRE